MLVKVNNIDVDKNKVRVSKLDIDGYGSVIPHNIIITGDILLLI
jgi:hypothetical protein